MNLLLISPFPLTSIAEILFILIVVRTTQAATNDNYTRCHEPYKCGPNTFIKYPFYGNNRPSFCGVSDFAITCENDEYSFASGSQERFNILTMAESNRTITIAQADLWSNHCPKNLNVTTRDATLFSFSLSTKNITLCPFDHWDDTGSPRINFSCDDSVFVLKDPGVPECKDAIEIPVLTNNLEMFHGGNLSFPDLLKGGFEVYYVLDDNKWQLCNDCESSGGICGTNSSSTTDRFICYCKDRSYAQSCPEKSSHVTRNILIGFTALGGALLIAGLVFIVLRFRNKKGKPNTSSRESRDISSYGSSIVDLEKSSSYFGVQVFDYNDLQEATNNFDENKVLGDGGFGVVYQGKLRDGRVVAVKRLYERNFKRVGQFMNEVEILALLHHQNLVTLYGCTSRNSRELLLVYEYVSNGTVADHLHGDRATPGSLSWITRMRIAIETAKALLFLHKKDVIHRDVKTNNILLDDHFVVKVADFGLSRLYPNNVTHVSTAPQGTPGYVDPEYHQCYRLTDKSDVYSFGVVLIELVSSMPAVDIARHSHYINLSDMAIEKIQKNVLCEIVDPYLGFDSDFKVRKMIIGVAELAFQCLQNGRDRRPSMSEVFETLQRISSEDYSENIEEMEISGDGDMISRNDPPTMSSDSTTSNSTPPNSCS